MRPRTIYGARTHTAPDKDMATRRPRTIYGARTDIAPEQILRPTTIWKHGARERAAPRRSSLPRCAVTRPILLAPSTWRRRRRSSVRASPARPRVSAARRSWSRRERETGGRERDEPAEAGCERGARNPAETGFTRGGDTMLTERRTHTCRRAVGSGAPTGLCDDVYEQRPPRGCGNVGCEHMVGPGELILREQRTKPGPARYSWFERLFGAKSGAKGSTPPYGRRERERESGAHTRAAARLGLAFLPVCA